MDAPWPPTADDLSLSRAKAIVPKQLFNFLAVCTGLTEDVGSASEFVDLPDSSQSKLLSICQDILFLSSGGKTQTPKSLALGLTIRHMTGSSNLQSLISRFGHCSSYDTICRLETALAAKQLHASPELPVGFRKDFAVLVYDNIDFAEETLSGAGTTHHTNGIMFQLRADGDQANSQNVNVPLSKRARHLTPMDSDILPYHLAKKQGPQKLKDVEYPSAGDCLNRVKDQLFKEYVYTALKWHSPTAVPCWTMFNSIVAIESLSKSLLHYLPVIEASPTEMRTVNEILRQSMHMAKKLEIDVIVVVFDQAIYSKAQQIRWKTPDFQQVLVIRMGEFHTTMAFLAMLGKRVELSGFEDVLIEAQAVAQGSMKGVLNGHQYNRSIRAHKLFSDSLKRMQLEKFRDEQTDEVKEQITAALADDIINIGNEWAIDFNKHRQFHDLFQSHIAEQCSKSQTY